MRATTYLWVGEGDEPIIHYSKAPLLQLEQSGRAATLSTPDDDTIFAAYLRRLADTATLLADQIDERQATSIEAAS